MNSHNPFADDLQPQDAQRLQSAADPLNPYAAPAGIDTRMNHGPGIGFWRDGKWLVMHLEAQFPPRCIYSNEPAKEYREQKLKWSYKLDYGRRTLLLKFGVGEQGLLQLERTRRNWMLLGYVSAAVGVCGLLATGIALSLEHYLTAQLAGQFLLYGIVIAAIAFFQAGKGGSPFLFRNAKESYLWLIGTPPPFLNSLPEWPGFGK